MDGFAQGARATVHLDIKRVKIRTTFGRPRTAPFGIALGEALGLDPEKKGRTSGLLPGRVGFTVETE